MFRPRIITLVVTLALVLPLAPAGVLAEDPTPVPLLASLAGFVPSDHAGVPAMAAGIGPGTNLYVERPGEGVFGCTANFLWTAGGKTYLGAAGHCFLPPGRTATHGPGADFNASAIRVWACASDCVFGGEAGVFFTGTTVELGAVAYARQKYPGLADIGNDFGLVEVPAALSGALRASLPVWGGPTTSAGGLASGLLCFYGNGIVLAETYPTMARAGAGVASHADGSWQGSLPSMPGDSGAAVVNCEPREDGLHGTMPVGVLTHGVPGYTFGTSVGRAKSLAQHAGLTIKLVAAP